MAALGTTRPTSGPTSPSSAGLIARWATQTGADGFNDSYAYLTGFSPDVTEQATIYKDPTIVGDPLGSHEVELLLRVNDTSSSVQAYECNISFDGAYAQIVRWNGPLGNFTYLDSANVIAAFGRAPQTGDIFSASIVGSTITVWLDGVQLMTTSDSTYATGNPGIGMWLHDSNDPTKFAFTNYSVSDVGSPPPPPPGDTTAPAQPKISSFSPDSAPTNDGHTTATTLTLSGTGEANSTIQVFDGTNSIGTASVNASGTWNIPASNLAVGSHSFTATDTDAAGNTSVKSAPLAVTIDSSSAPPPPVTANLLANGDFETGDFTGWTLSGNVGTSVWGPQVFINSNAESGKYGAVLGPVGSDGTLSQNIQTTAGESYTVTFWLANRSGGPDDFTAKWNGQTLLALNNAPQQGYTEYTYQVSGSGSTSNLEFDFRQDPTDWNLDNVSVVDNGAASGGGSPPPPSTIDTTAPAQPKISSFSPDLAPTNDGHTTATTLTLSGTGEANSTIQVFDGTNSIGTAPVNASGTWNIPASNLAVGSHSFTATDTDAAGNTSVKSAPLAVTIDLSSAPPPPVDTTAPAQPKISSFSPDTARKSDGHTTATTLTLSGAGEANSTIQVFDGTNSIGTTAVNSSGAWNISASNLALGSHSFTAADTDAAGNTSVKSTPLSVTIDPSRHRASINDSFGLLTQFMAAQVGSNGGGGTVVSSQPAVNSDPVTLANPFGLAHS